MFTVAVVEDNYPVRKGLVHTLEQHKHLYRLVGEAEDGLAAQSLLLQQRPQIVLMDIRLPGLSGLDVIRHVREHYQPQVVVVSGYTEFEYARQALSLGVLAYLVKPVDEGELEQSLRYAVSKLLNSSSQPDLLGNPTLTALEQQCAEDMPAEGASPLQTYYVHQIMAYIRSHYFEDFSLADLAEALELSESYLSKIFKQNTTFTINEYNNNYRLEQAAKLLADPRHRISEVARYVGIENQRYFSHLFKRKMGVTPSQYREAVLSQGAPRKTEN